MADPANRLRRKKGRRPKAQERRGSAAKRGYDRSWRIAREEFLAEFPLCRSCEASGLTALALVVDHVIPHRGDRELFWRRSNWQPLCRRCHDLKTASGQ